MRLTTPNFQEAMKVLVNPEASTDKLNDLLTALKDPNNGVKHCLTEFRAIYKPAVGPTTARGIFLVLKDNFNNQFKNHTMWAQKKAVTELTTTHHIMHRMVLQVTNLFTLWSAMFTAEINKHAKEREDNSVAENDELDRDKAKVIHYVCEIRVFFNCNLNQFLLHFSKSVQCRHLLKTSSTSSPLLTKTSLLASWTIP